MEWSEIIPPVAMILFFAFLLDMKNYALKRRLKESDNWINPERKTPEMHYESWCPEEIAQEVLVKYSRSGRTQITVGWFEDGKWYSNDEVLEYRVVGWMYLPKN